jgi:hypothetical protein
MWTSDQISVEIEEADRREMIVVITTPVRTLWLMANVSIVDRILHLEGTHIGGLKPGALVGLVSMRLAVS